MSDTSNDSVHLLLQTVATQAQTIKTQAETISRLLSETDQVLDPELELVERTSYMDGTPIR